MAVPSEPALAVVAGLRGIPCHHILDGAGGDVSIMGQARGKGWPIVESVGLAALGKLKLLLEGVDGVPELEHLFLLLREVRPLGHGVETGFHLVFKVVKLWELVVVGCTSKELNTLIYN